MRWPGQARAVERFARAVDPDAGRPEDGRPEDGRPEDGRPDAGRPDAGRPDGEPDRLVAVVDRLRAVNGTSDPDPAFRVGLRERLVATAAAEWAAPPPAETAEAAGPPARPPGRLWVRTRYALAGAFAAVLVVTGLVLASGSALPGDTLYPVKRATERVELAFTFGQEAKGRRCLAEARTRAQEIRALLDRSEPGPGGGPSAGTPVTGSPGSPTSSGSAGPGGGSATGSAATGSGGTGQGSGAPGAGPGGSPAGGNGLPLPTVPGLPLPTNTLPLPTNTLPLPLPTLPLPT